MSRASRWALPALVCLLLIGFAAGIWGTYREAFPARGVYRVTGVVLRRVDDTMLLVGHEPVPGLMEQMESMAVIAESKDVLDRASLEKGDRVRLVVRQQGGDLIATEIQKIR